MSLDRSIEKLEERFEKYLSERGLRHSRPRELVVREFLKTSEHLSIEDLLKKVQRQDPKIGIATVYRAMNLLVEASLAVKREFATGSSAYEKMPTRHHDHLLCTGCGRIVEFHREAIERMQDEIASRYGFILDFHKMELYGRCKACRKSG
jgi:Fur family transcriptional regulator, ferric uptake regulator